MKYLIFLILCILQPICLPVPEATTILTGTVTLGPHITFIIGLIGIMSGIIFMYGLTFSLSKRYLKKITKSPKYKKYQQFMKKNPFLTTGILFSIPIIPDEIMCIGSALGGISLKILLPIALFSKIISIGMITYSEPTATFLDIKQWQVIILELIIMFIAAFIYSNYKNKKNTSKS